MPSTLGADDNSLTLQILDAETRRLEASVDNDLIEVCVAVELLLVFCRPSLSSSLAGVLLQGDVVAAAVPSGTAELGVNDFIRIRCGSWLRERSNRSQIFQSTSDYWIPRTLPGAAKELVSRLELPTTLHLYEVTGVEAFERPFPSLECETCSTWSKGSIIEAASEPACGWSRITRSCGHRLQTKSTFVSHGQGCQLKYMGTQSITSPYISVSNRTSKDNQDDVQSDSALPNRPMKTPGSIFSVDGTIIEPTEDDDVEPMTVPELIFSADGSIVEPIENKDVAASSTESFPMRTTAAPPVEGGAEGRHSGFESVSSPPSEPSIRRRPAAYYGICDLKYDSRREYGQQIRVLELGSGRASRFSGDGGEIPRAYQRNFVMVRQLERALLVDNKKVTHDVFVECGCQSLRPRQTCYARVYDPGLHKRIAEDLEVDELRGESVVLKLVNRCRGAGVVVARAGEELDVVLRKLLAEPHNSPELSGDDALNAALAAEAGSIEEHCLHWRSNESPVFVVERCEVSEPVAKDGQLYDGTLRVAFVLLRADASDDSKLGIEFLGGYWKLPADPVTSADVQTRCVSKARTGTLPVKAGDLANVCYELGRVLPDVFAIERHGAASVVRRYQKDPLLFAFTMARQAASQIYRDPSERARWTKPVPRNFKIAKDRLSEVPKTRAACAVHSYIERQVGAAQAMSGNWEQARLNFQRSLEFHSFNATSEYLLGTCFLKEYRYAEARSAFVRSISMDPDFKAPYANLSAVCLAVRDFEAAERVCEAGLKRHPFAYQCSYNLGLALAWKLRSGLSTGDRSVERLETHARRSELALLNARGKKDGAKTDWTSQDCQLLEAVSSLAEHLGTGCTVCDSRAWLSSLTLRDIVGWEICNFRP